MKRFIYFLMALLGFGSLASCESRSNNMAMYGVPVADYKVSARVVDEEGNPIKNIKVTVGHDVGYNNNVTHSAEDGTVEHETKIGGGRPTILFEDVDGEANGGEFESVILEYYRYKNKTTQIAEPDGWYSGKYEVNLGDVEMKLKPQSEESTDEDNTSEEE